MEDYYDNEGNLYIDARKQYIKKENVRNLKVYIDSIDTSDNNVKKLIMHHTNVIDINVYG